MKTVSIQMHDEELAYIETVAEGACRSTRAQIRFMLKEHGKLLSTIHNLKNEIEAMRKEALAQRDKHAEALISIATKPTQRALSEKPAKPDPLKPIKPDPYTLEYHRSCVAKLDRQFNRIGRIGLPQFADPAQLEKQGGWVRLNFYASGRDDAKVIEHMWFRPEFEPFEESQKALGITPGANPGTREY